MQFDAAHRNALTWRDFIGSLGPAAEDFITYFIGADGEPEPADDELMSELRSRVWILSDGDFPLLQCSEESYRFYYHLLPEDPGRMVERTEYGELYALYPVNTFETVRLHRRRHGHRVSRVTTPLNSNTMRPAYRSAYPPCWTSGVSPHVLRGARRQDLGSSNTCTL